MKRARVGDSAWFVEWVRRFGMVHQDFSEWGGDPSKDVKELRQFPDRVQAMEYAESIKLTAWRIGGPVTVWPAEFKPIDPNDAERYPDVGSWEPSGDVETMSQSE